MSRVRKVCRLCRSEEVWYDANASWDPENQCWELKNTFDAAYCDECDGETTIVDEAEPEEATVVAEPIPALVLQRDRVNATILGALRAIQNIQQHEALAPEITEILTDGGRFAPLDDGEIDQICERLNQ